MIIEKTILLARELKTGLNVIVKQTLICKKNFNGIFMIQIIRYMYKRVYKEEKTICFVVELIASEQALLEKRFST